MLAFSLPPVATYSETYRRAPLVEQLASIICLRVAEWLGRDTAVRLKVEWVSSLTRLAHHLNWSVSQRIILQFNKLINVIWQVVSSALGGSKRSLQSHLKACSITMLTKAWTGTETEMAAFWGSLRDAADPLFKRSHSTLRGQAQPDLLHYSGQLLSTFDSHHINTWWRKAIK